MINVGVDWGSSSFRAYLFDGNGKVIDFLESDTGIKFVEDGRFQETLFQQIGHWLNPGDGVVLSGMITSRNGWMETPYVSCPANLEQLMKGVVRTEANGVDLIFLPGLSQAAPWDVMRGEELQLFGVDSIQPIRLAVMPGTHSKWASVVAGEITGFHTIATGELFEILLNHSLVGGLGQGRTWRETDFANGVDKGFNSAGIVRDLFTCRAGVLLEQLSSDGVFSYLSGLLIGNEIREGTTLTSMSATHAQASAFNGNNNDSPNQSVTLIGNALLCQRYQSAFTQLGFSAVLGEDQAVVPGFAEIIAQFNH